MKYFENRQKADGLIDEELEDSFKCIVEHFSYKWIKSPRSHPLQRLWERKDVLATNELFFFGKCLKNMTAKDPKWVRQQISKIKSDNINNIQGALFEINGLGMIASPTQNLVPASNNQPGFDGIYTFDDLSIVRFSLKNYGDSYYYKEFNNFATLFEKKLVEILKEKNLPPLQFIVDSANRFPTKTNWDELINNFQTFLVDVKKGQPKIALLNNFWLVIYSDLTVGVQDFHPNHNSYTLILSTPYHKNEEKNLIDKLDEACANLNKHTKFENENSLNAVFIHLPESASIKKCNEWSKSYFENFPNKPVSIIFLYQPTVVTDLKNERNFIHHCFQVITRKGVGINHEKKLNLINFIMPVGVLSDTPSENKIVIEVDGKKQTFDFFDKYIFQRGNHYLMQKTQEDGTIVGNITRLASGVFTHSVFQPFPEQQSFILSGNFAPIDKLLIL